MEVSRCLQVFAVLVLLIHATDAQRGSRPTGPNDGGDTGGAGTCGTGAADSVVTVTVEGNYYKITGSGCPGYDWTGQTTPNSADIKTYEWMLPVTPTICTTSQIASSVMGMTGIAKNGVAIFGPLDATGADAYVNEGQTFDTCQGHNSPGTYHYHSEPLDTGCNNVLSNPSGGHSSLWGLMADGVPIYGHQSVGGAVPTDLDECGGHVDSEKPFYHYHATDPATFNQAGDGYPYTYGCLKGKVDTTMSGSTGKSGGTCTEASTQYDYSGMAADLVSWGLATGAVPPTSAPPADPTSAPTFAPRPSASPTPQPTPAPTRPATPAPTRPATSAPTFAPRPSASPTPQPTPAPTRPTAAPTFAPRPSAEPTAAPTGRPTTPATRPPTDAPATRPPTNAPTQSPTVQRDPKEEEEPTAAPTGAAPTPTRPAPSTPSSTPTASPADSSCATVALAWGAIAMGMLVAALH
mmetsp:Transcript_3746/g.4191  ORF Transcript_3746/g.4191 Transcript_3746/m.4191 type:complete len:464 (-) Transcript_3746:120-1511(-)|eukprot:CAMPEP_0197853436 /NCGR_PEP_ID=MMETSP1438-20131217/22733_1 /TAXON_ID=1461541 /ORGANISM="Pterosperma sp., Strain CCMP1384" /LENGTH=463 /DNA_ID=CAMNT_0043467847 /DNA_START=110 /DNA_END=1501 /DNA_ORIENTATION=-